MISSTNTVDKYWCDSSKSYDVTIEFMNDPSNLYVVVLDYITKTETILSYTESTAGTGEFSFDSTTSKITTGDLFEGGGSGDPKDKITITTKLDYLQKTDITSNSNYDPEVLESAYDNAVMLTRQNKDTIGRSLTLSLSDSGETMELPPKDSLANSFLHFDTEGNPEPQIGVLPRVYDPEFLYVIGDITQHNGDIWIVVQDIPQTSGINDYAPGDNTAYWVQYVGRYDMWDVDLPYPKGAITSYTDGVYESTLVRSKGDGNIGHIPLLTPGATDNYWEIVKTGGAVIVQGEINNTDTVSQFDLVYFDTDGTLSIGDKSELSKSILSGFATTGGNPNETIEVQSKGLLDGFSDLLKGSRYYLGEAGGIALKGEIEYQDYIVSVGVAKSTTIMDVNIGLPEPTRNQDDSINVGNAIPVYGTVDANGYLYADARAISRANYPILFNTIGTTFGAGDGSTTFNIPAQSDYATLGDSSLKWHIKVEHVTTSGEPISALRDSQPWVEFTGDWTNKEFIITPADSIGYSNVDDIYDLQVEIWLADDATPTNSIRILTMQKVITTGSGDTYNAYGIGIRPNDTSSFKLITGQDGVLYFNTTTGYTITLGSSSTGAYKVIITKPNLVSTIFDVSSLPHPPYDLTSENVIVTLPAITGVLQTKSIYWTNGGTYKLRIKRDDGTYLDYEGEGNGHILVESDGSNWQVREYEDSGAGWKKELDGRLLQWDKVVKNNGSTDPQTFNFPKTFYSTEIVINITQADASHSTEARVASTPTITQWACVIYSTSGSLTNGNRTISMQATGTWK